MLNECLVHPGALLGSKIGYLFLFALVVEHHERLVDSLWFDISDMCVSCSTCFVGILDYDG